MPKFNMEVAHQLGQDEATDRLKQFVDNVRDRYKDQVSKLDGAWNENMLKFFMTTYGFDIDGVVTVEEERVLLEGTLPFAAVAFRGKIAETIATEIQRELS